MISACVSIAAAAQLYPFAAWAPGKLVEHGLLSDDAFFYGVLARNFQRFGFLTLDGEMPTNGIQPLWMLVQAALAAAFPGADPAALLARSSWAIYLLFAFAFSWFLLRRVSRGNALAAGAAVALVPLNAAFQGLVVTGLETPLALLLLMLFAIALDRAGGAAEGPESADRRRPTARAAAALAVLCALVFLARTDLLWVSAAGFAWVAARRGPRSRAGAAFGAATLVLALPYLVLNVARHGGIVPISGIVKLHHMKSCVHGIGGYLSSDEWRGPAVAFMRSLGLRSFAVAAILAYALLAAGFWYVWRLRRALSAGLLVAGGALFAHIVFMQAGYRELRPYTAYYFAPEVAWISLVAAAWLGRRRVPNVIARRPAAVAIIVAVAATGTTLLRDIGPSAYWRQRLALAHDITSIVPSGERVGAFWPGLFAYAAGRPVVPLDGVIGSYGYFRDYVKRGREIDYLVERGIRFVAIYLPGDPSAAIVAETPPHLSDWSRLGELRLWERRSAIVGVPAARPVSEDGAGWYLVEIERAPADRGIRRGIFDP